MYLTDKTNVLNRLICKMFLTGNLRLALITSVKFCLNLEREDRDGD